jgi:hypothetical protein
MSDQETRKGKAMKFSKTIALFVVTVLALGFSYAASAATLKGVGKTLIDADSRAEQGEGTGHKKVIYDTYELAADAASADVIQLGSKIPANARILDVTLFFDDLGTGSSATVDVGWQASPSRRLGGTTVINEAADADGFMADVNVWSASTSQSMQGDQPTRPGNFKKFTDQVQPAVTFDGEPDATTGTVTLLIEYVVE